METTIIERFIEIQRKILSEFALSWNKKESGSGFKADVKSYYGFDNDFGWNILMNSFYVLEDTELSKKSFGKFGLQGPSRHKDVGERYLRLYGILNAFYQQKLAISNLIETHKIPNKSNILRKLDKYQIIELRHKIGSHASNYFNSDERDSNDFDVYEISRPELKRDNIRLLKNQNDFELYDFNKAIKEFNQEIESLLSIITKKIIKGIFNNQGKFYQKYLAVEALRTGDINIFIDQNKL